ncbi:hypothetical protein A2U01_0062761, partial [Trifolium medium]|nr:hypothetical protein [Trifolium medium]
MIWSLSELILNNDVLGGDMSVDVGRKNLMIPALRWGE